MPNTQKRQDVQMFACLGHDTVIGSDHEDHAVNAGCAGDHCFDKVLVTGNVDDTDFQIAQLTGSKAKFDSHPAFFFRFESISFTTCKQPDQCGLTMIDMACGAESNVYS